MAKVIAIIQARMGSTRLPGKVLMDIVGHPMLWHVLARVRRAQMLDDIIIATSSADSDNAIVNACHAYGAAVYRGSEYDVLDRYYQAASAFNAEVVVRLTADCPLLDHNVIDLIVSTYLDSRAYDYISNTAPPTFPDGLDTEVFSYNILEQAWREARLKSEREHVTLYIRNHPELFRIGNVENDKDLSDIRLTVDEREDLQFVRTLYDTLRDKDFSMGDILQMLTQNPELRQINAHIIPNAGLLKSLQEDKIQ